jgi:hypothetical protein
MFVIRDDTTQEAELQYESEVVESNIYNKFQKRCITEEKLNQFKQLNYGVFLYLYFNREILYRFIVSEHNDHSDTDSDGVIGFTSDDEHDFPLESPVINGWLY